MRTYKVVLNTDGSSRGNPGKGGWGASFSTSKKTFSGCGQIYPAYANKVFGIEITAITNQQAEYIAVYEGLFGIALLVKSIKGLTTNRINVEVNIDLKGLVQVLNKPEGGKDVKLKCIIARIRTLQEKFHSVTYTHVKREKNAITDDLAKQGSDPTTNVPYRKWSSVAKST